MPPVLVGRAMLALLGRPHLAGDNGEKCGSPATPEGARPKDGNPRGPYAPSRQRERLSSEFLGHLLAWMRNSGPKAIARVGKTQPAALLKIIALMLPREHKVEAQTRSLSEVSDQQLDGMIELLTARVEARAAGIDVPPLIDVTPEGDVLEPDVTKPRGKRTNAIVANADTSVVARPGYKRVKPRRTKGY